MASAGWVALHAAFLATALTCGTDPLVGDEVTTCLDCRR